MVKTQFYMHLGGSGHLVMQVTLMQTGEAKQCYYVRSFSFVSSILLCTISIMLSYPYLVAHSLILPTFQNTYTKHTKFYS